MGMARRINVTKERWPSAKCKRGCCMVDGKEGNNRGDCTHAHSRGRNEGNLPMIWNGVSAHLSTHTHTHTHARTHTHTHYIINTLYVNINKLNNCCRQTLLRNPPYTESSCGGDPQYLHNTVIPIPRSGQRSRPGCVS